MGFLGKLILTVIVLAAIAFFAAPAVGFFAIRSAAEANDVEGLSRLIDFGAVRQSLRPQMSGRPETMAPEPTFMEDPIGAVRRQFEQQAITGAPDVDVYLTPVAIAALTRGEGRLAAQHSTTGPSPDAATATGGPMPMPVYWGFNSARMAVSDEGGSRTVFTFERKGPFEWKLVHIGLPDGPTLDGPAPAPMPNPAPAAARQP